MAVVVVATNSAQVHSYYVKKALETLQPRLQLYKLGKQTPFPDGLGVVAKWLIYTKIASNTTPLTEGTNPAAISLTSSQVTATLAQYGQFLQISDLLETVSINPIISSVAELMGKSAAETIEDLIAAELDGALTIRRVNGESANNNVTPADIVVMKEFLASQIALKIAFVGKHEMGAYMAVLHPSCEYDILSESNIGGWLDQRSYAAQDSKGALNGEIGKVYGMRFLTSDKMTSAANSSSISVKNNYLLGEECFGVVELGKKSFDLVIKPSDSGGQANPLNMYGTVGYKLKGFVAKNFQAARGIVLKGASSYA